VSLNSTHCTNAASQVFRTALLTALLTAARLECDEDAAEKKSYIILFAAGQYDVWVLCFTCSALLTESKAEQVKQRKADRK
jgi:hypothetical protein